MYISVSQSIVLESRIKLNNISIKPQVRFHHKSHRIHNILIKEQLHQTTECKYIAVLLSQSLLLSFFVLMCGSNMYAIFIYSCKIYVSKP